MRTLATPSKKRNKTASLKHTCRRFVTIPCSSELLLSLKETQVEFETEARLLLAVKLYEQNRVSTGIAAQLAGITRVQFMFALDRYGLSPFGTDADKLAQDFANA